LFESTLKLQYNTVRGYVSAIQKLYDEQKSRGINPAARPQGVALKALKRSILATTWSRKRKEYMDRGVGTLRDVYSPAQIPDHTTVAWSERKEVACALRTQVDFLFGNHMLLRSGNRLPMELADCFPLELPNEGLKIQGHTTKALVVVMNCGKTNQHGRMEYGSALRHRDPRSCLIGALAFWFFLALAGRKGRKVPSLPKKRRLV
jgi:centromere DNA-binding complex CBF3 subunit-like protein